MKSRQIRLVPIAVGPAIHVSPTIAGWRELDELSPTSYQRPSEDDVIKNHWFLTAELALTATVIKAEELQGERPARRLDAIHRGGHQGHCHEVASAFRRPFSHVSCMR